MTFTEFSLALRHYGVTKVYLTEEGMQKIAEECNMFSSLSEARSNWISPGAVDAAGTAFGVQFFKDTKEP